MIFDAIIYVGILAAILSILAFAADFLDQHYPLRRRDKIKVL